MNFIVVSWLGLNNIVISWELSRKDRKVEVKIHGVNRVTEDFYGAIKSLLAVDQSEMGVKSDCGRAERVDRSIEMSGCVTAKVRSSAYEVTISAEEGQSCKNQLKRVGEMTEPCGTPERMMRCGLVADWY